MKKVLLAMFVLGMSATAQAGIVLNFARGGAETVKVTGMQISNGTLVVKTATGGGFTVEARALQDAGISSVEMVNLLNKYNNSKSTLKISGSSHIQYDTVRVTSLSLEF